MMNKEGGGYNLMYYDVEDISSATKLMYYAGTIKDGIIIVDGEVVSAPSGNKNVYYQFDTPGRHLVKYKETNDSGFARFEGITTLKEAYLSDPFPTDLRFFNGCSNLQKVELPHSVTELNLRMFEGCQSLELNTRNVESTTNTSGCRGIKVLVCPKLVTLSESAFRTNGGNGSLEMVDFGPNITTIGSYPFYGCTALTTIIFRAITPPSGGNYILYGLGTDYKVYVPYSADHSILSAYQSAMSNYSSRFFELDPDGTVPTN